MVTFRLIVLTIFLGKRHLENFNELTARAVVVAASTPDPEERKWAENSMENVNIYAEYSEMLDTENLDAVVVASATSVHAEQAIAAIKKGYHVLCEKPLSLDIKVVSISGTRARTPK